MLEILKTVRVLPVIEIDNADDAVPLAEALIAGGVTVFEFTMRTPAALDALKIAKKAVSQATIGMGTVCNREQGYSAIDAGADFLVTPGTTLGLLDLATSINEPVLMGAATPSDVMAIRDRDITLMKFFPAVPAGGRAYLKAFAGPFPDVTFCPTGGISRDDVDAFLALPNVVCVGGSWVAPRTAIKTKDWAAITANAKFASGQQ
ncbi:MAG: bifunctional 4-hydroxy-2-oxoglutarate aldolase/2-dehydro-3-deoxy-phosphogluconate aldolase [Pseudomonadota bacterium]